MTHNLYSPVVALLAWLLACCLSLSAEPVSVGQFPGATSVKACLSAPEFAVTDIHWSDTRTNWSCRQWADLLGQYRVVVFPGGSGGEMFSRLGPGGQQAVREFVSRGGGYLGICAGAWLAAKRYLGIANIEGVKPWYVGVGGLEVAMEKDATNVFASAPYLAPARRMIEMHNGPLWSLTPPDPSKPPCRVLASYTGRTGTDKNGGGLFTGRPAIVTDVYGQGKMILFSPHPELVSTNGNFAMIPEAVRWLTVKNSGSDTNAAPSYLIAREGGLPIILSAPHGGALPFPGVPVRTGGKDVKQFAVARDVSTDRLALELSAALQRETGKAPFVVVAQVSRKYVDINRAEKDAFESPQLREVYEAYHAELAKYCRQVARKWGGGLLLDLHGQSAKRDSIFRGTRNGATTEMLVKKFGDPALTGPQGFQGLLEAQGFKMVPASDSGKKETSFNGGYIAGTYGLNGSYGIDAIQLEFGGAYTAQKALPETAKNLAAALSKYVTLYLVPTNSTSPLTGEAVPSRFAWGAASDKRPQSE